MIEEFTWRVTDKLVKEKYIDIKQKEEYAYVMIMLLEKWISIMAIILLGIYFQKIIPTFFFLVFLLEIKKRSGGYHVDKFITCFLVTIGIYSIFVILLLPIMLQAINVTYAILAVSIIILEIIGAVNHPNMNWNIEEYKRSKKMSRTVVALEGIVIICFIYLGVCLELIVFMAFAVILSALLLLLAKISKQEVFQ